MTLGSTHKHVKQRSFKADKVTMKGAGHLISYSHHPVRRPTISDPQGGLTMSWPLACERLYIIRTFCISPQVIPLNIIRTLCVLTKVIPLNIIRTLCILTKMIPLKIIRTFYTSPSWQPYSIPSNIPPMIVFLSLECCSPLIKNHFLHGCWISMGQQCNPSYAPLYL